MERRIHSGWLASFVLMQRRLGRRVTNLPHLGDHPQPACVKSKGQVLCNMCHARVKTNILLGTVVLGMQATYHMEGTKPLVYTHVLIAGQQRHMIKCGEQCVLE